MSWTRPADLRGQVQRWWDRGELLTCLLTGEPAFPRRLVLKGPASGQMPEHFDEVRTWIAELRRLRHVRLVLREFRHRVLGQNLVPEEAWIDTLDEALALIGRRREAALFGDLIEQTRERQPLLLDWLARRPLRALELADPWPRLLDIAAWVQDHPRCGLYLRQVDLPGVHTKFIETHRGVLAEWLDRILPPEAVDAAATGSGQFARRYGFRDKPARIRFRMLDPLQALLPGQGEQDITLDASSFARLKPRVSRVFITENEVNFLALPHVADSLVIFGAGYGFESLADARWLADCRIHYWGDIDTHGFAILDQLRSRFQQVESLLMDRATFLAFQALWNSEDKQTLRDLPRLNRDEAALYDDLRDNRLGRNLRLEQERIGFGCVESALSRLR